jgi:hypothetical protein
VSVVVDVHKQTRNYILYVAVNDFLPTVCIRHKAAKFDKHG